ncbi:flavoprotein [Actinomadura craniellae]|uniref:flavoprotein n=1 Tax=Actinomadura craniellae TaxID=2231787 RepID=UPI001F300D32|nr:flavoprotein [Actinomadura craniellae]
MADDEARRVLYVIVCAAPAAAEVAGFIRLAQSAGWRVFAVVSPLGRRFVDVNSLASLTGGPVRSEFRLPWQPKELPPADAVVVAPATFNTVNKWAAGIADTFATALLCEQTGLGVPVLAVPQTNDGLARHVAFGRNLDVLRSMGVRVLFDPAGPQGRVPPWEQVLAELRDLTT